MGDSVEHFRIAALLKPRLRVELQQAGAQPRVHRIGGQAPCRQSKGYKNEYPHGAENHHSAL
jgi:hypothetical protein